MLAIFVRFVYNGYNLFILKKSVAAVYARSAVEFEMDIPIISIIIPTYRCAERLQLLMDCLTAQTFGFEKLEVLFADDCSPDDTGRVIDSLSARFSNVSALHLPANSGFAGAPRNAAIHAAHAPYLMFLDADDLLPPNACQTLYDGLLKTDADLVTGYCRYVDENGGVLQEISPAYAELHPRITHLPEELSDELLMRDSFWCCLYKSNIVSENGLFFPTGVPGEDIFFLYSYLLCCRSAAYLAQHVYDYYSCNASVTHNRSSGYYIGLGDCYRKIQTLFEKAGQPALFSLVADHILEFHLCGMMDSACMTEADIATALPAWGWLFQYETAQGTLDDSPLADALAPLVSAECWDTAAHTLRLCAPLRTALERSRAETEQWKKHAFAFQKTVTDMRNSRSWRITHLFSKG